MFDPGDLVRYHSYSMDVDDWNVVGLVLEVRLSTLYRLPEVLVLWPDMPDPRWFGCHTLSLVQELRDCGKIVA